MSKIDKLEDFSLVSGKLKKKCDAYLTSTVFFSRKKTRIFVLFARATCRLTVWFILGNGSDPSHGVKNVSSAYSIFLFQVHGIQRVWQTFQVATEDEGKVQFHFLFRFILIQLRYVGV